MAVKLDMTGDRVHMYQNLISIANTVSETISPLLTGYNKTKDKYKVWKLQPSIYRNETRNLVSKRLHIETSDFHLITRFQINYQIKGSIRYIFSQIESFKYAGFEPTTTILHVHSFLTPSKVSYISSLAISCKILTVTNLDCGALLLRGREYTTFLASGKSVSFLINTSGEKRASYIVDKCLTQELRNTG